MPVRSPAWRETWRVLAYTLVVALAFLALNRLQRAWFGSDGTSALLARIGWIDGDAGLQREAVEIATASRDAWQRLPRAHAAAALRIGYALGYASEWAGSFTMSPPALRADANAVAARYVAAARDAGARIGIADIDAVAVRNLQEFGTLVPRIEADANGVAARIERTLSPLHRHLYLLGAHVGVDAARADASGGRSAPMAAALIRRHATLAGVDRVLWEPLATPPRGATPAAALLRLRADTQALEAALQRPGALAIDLAAAARPAAGDASAARIGR